MSELQKSYPNHAKMLEHRRDFSIIQAFLSELGELGYFLASVDKDGEWRYANTDHVALEYFGIDADEFEDEKDDLYEKVLKSLEESSGPSENTV